VDRIIAPQPGKQPVLRVNVSVGLVIGDCVVQHPVEHLFPSLSPMSEIGSRDLE
jgi:hypothetical protein